MGYMWEFASGSGVYMFAFIKYFILSITISSLLFGSPIKNSIEIAKFVMSPQGGYITEEIHSEFWDPIPMSDRDKVSKDVQKYVIMAQEYQQSFWKDILATIKNNKKVISPKTKQYLDILKNNAYTKKAHENSLKMLEHALGKTPMKTSDGHSFYITSDMAKKVLSGLNAGIERVDILMKPNWNPKLKERPIGKNTKILWPLPFVYEVSKVNGLEIKKYSSHWIDGTTVVISNTFVGQKTEFKNSKECASGAIQSITGNSPKMITEDVFRNFPSAKTQYIFNEKNEKIFIQVRCVSANKRLFAIIALGDSMLSSLEALENIENNIIFN